MRTACRFLLLASFVVLLAAPSSGQGLVIERGDFNYGASIQTEFRQYQNLDLAGGILPFDPNAGHWDFSGFAAGSAASVDIVDPSVTPYASTFPQATGCGVQTLAGQPVVYSYEAQTPDAQYTLGFGTNQLGTTIRANFNPDWKVYSFPMQVGDAYSQTFQWSYRVIIITVTVTETHSFEVVAEGTVEVPGVPYPMPCLVMREFAVITDSLGTTDNYYGYYWIVPDGFAGSNGVAALQSQTNATPSFTICRNTFFLSANNLDPLPALPSLTRDTSQISQSAGGTVNFTLNAGLAHAGRDYLLVGSASGQSPGTAVPGGARMPLNRDTVTDFILANVGTPQFQNFQGTLDGQGMATASWVTSGPLPPAALGLHIDFGYTTTNPYDFQSNTTWVEVQP